MVTVERIDNLLTRLAIVPARIAGIVAGWSEEKLRRSTGANSWSAVEILAHLRASDDIVTPRAYALLVRTNPPLTAFDERRWAEVAHYKQQDFHILLHFFTLRRRELVQMLQSLPSEGWMRSGQHEVYGTQSLFAILTALVEHEEEHCAQLSALYRS